MLQSEDLNIDLSVLRSEPAEEYHAKASEYLSSHQLLDFMACPKLYHDKRLGLIHEEQTPSMLIGTAAHVRILEGSAALGETYAIGGPINKTTGNVYGSNTKAFKQWAAAQNKPVLTAAQVRIVDQLATGVATNSEAVDLIIGGVAEGVIRTIYSGELCQARLDYLHPHYGLIDLKTIKDLDKFEYEARDRRYTHQLAFYRSLLAQVTGQMVPVTIIAVEKQTPQRCGCWRVSEASLDRAAGENEAAIDALKRCRRDNHWPTGYEEMRLLEVF